MVDREAILELTAAHEVETSPLDGEALDRLIAEAFHVGLADDGRAAFLIAFAESADYASPNFLWLRRRLSRFVYVDRVVVSPAARGQGLARGLYREVFDHTLASGRSIVCCEVNKVPPNEASDRFHAALGFGEIGQDGTADGKKRVRYLARTIG